jgi:uncharacterized RDD family membrane protein YckC
MIVHQVVTTERVPFSYRVAGLGARFLAALVDVLVLVVLFFVGLVLGSVLELGARTGLGLTLFFFWQFALFWGYYLLFEWLWHGQTLGKRIVGIRVIRCNGTSLSFVQAGLRNLVRVVDLLPGFYGVGFLAALCNREQRRLGDLAADTLVVHVERRAPPIQAVLDAEADAARLAQWRQRLGRLDRSQRQTLLDLCLRRDQLRVAERAQLFRTAADHIKKRLEILPERYESDEKFVLKLGAILGERGGRPDTSL